MNAAVSVEQDTDSVYILPLQIIPLMNTGLQKARLVKNAHLEGVVELFADGSSGSGQIYPRDLINVFDFEGERRRDFEIVCALGKLPSYDVYSLRLELRDLGINLDGVEHLRLSKAKQLELTEYMRSFTRPLVAAIYGEGNDTDKSFGDILKLFLDPSVQSARQKLVDLAIALNIGIEEIPAFLERYADIYMSLAYYRGCLEALSPGLTDILETIKSLSSSSPYRDDPTLMQACKLIQDRLENAKSGIANIIVLFETRTQDMWNDVSHQSFREIDDLITSYQREMGGAICALTVKEMAWSRLTGKNSLSNCAACIMSDIVRGIDLVPVIEFADEPGA